MYKYNCQRVFRNKSQSWKRGKGISPFCQTGSQIKSITLVNQCMHSHMWFLNDVICRMNIFTWNSRNFWWLQFNYIITIPELRIVQLDFQIDQSFEFLQCCFSINIHLPGIETHVAMLSNKYYNLAKLKLIQVWSLAATQFLLFLIYNIWQFYNL